MQQSAVPGPPGGGRSAPRPDLRLACAALGAGPGRRPAPHSAEAMATSPSPNRPPGPPRARRVKYEFRPCARPAPLPPAHYFRSLKSREKRVLTWRRSGDMTESWRTLARHRGHILRSAPEQHRLRDCKAIAQGVGAAAAGRGPGHRSAKPSTSPEWPTPKPPAPLTSSTSRPLTGLG